MSKTKYAVFTMDVEAFSDTECISQSGVQVEEELLDGFDEYLDLLDRHGIKSTLFTVGRLAPKIADKLKKHIRNGHRLALHNHEHIAPMDMQLQKFEQDIRNSKQELSRLLTTDVVGFRAPCFSLDRERLEVLRELGFKYDSSYLGFTKANHTVPLDLSDYREFRKGIFHNKGFYEFGLSRQKVFGRPFPISGGGYVRLSNWSFMKTLIRQYIRKHSYYVFYLHPFELSNKKVPVFKGLKAYDKYYLTRGIGTYRKKVEHIIKMLKACGYQFVTFEELTDIMDREYVQA